MNHRRQRPGNFDFLVHCELYCHALCDRRRGIGLTIGFITIVHSSTIQLSLSGLPQSYNSRLNMSQQFRSQRNRCNPGNRRTPGSLPSFPWSPTNQLTHSPTQLSNNSLDTNSLQLLQLTTENSEVYDLWSDCRGDSAFGIVGCLAITRETGTLRPRACTVPSNVYSTACTSQYNSGS
jgi:hypothetical protein